MRNQPPQVTAGYDLKPSRFHRRIYQRNPEVDHGRLVGFRIEIGKVLVPGDDRDLIARQFSAQIELWMRQYLRAYERLDNIEYPRAGHERKQARGLVPFALDGGQK